MKQIPLSIHLSKDEIKILAGRYHFNDTDLFQVTCIYEAMKSMIKPMAYYKIGKSKEELNFIEYSPFVACIVTLGIEVDTLQDLYSDAEAVLEAYIVECISMELLTKAYEQLAEKIQEENGRWLKSYDFLGDKYPLEKIEEIFQYIPQDTVTYNEALMLVPKKSVVFLAELVTNKEEINCNLCSNCGNTNCLNRNPIKPISKGIKEKNLSYGYQRIFGTESGPNNS